MCSLCYYLFVYFARLDEYIIGLKRLSAVLSADEMMCSGTCDPRQASWEALSLFSLHVGSSAELCKPSQCNEQSSKKITFLSSVVSVTEEVHCSVFVEDTTLVLIWFDIKKRRKDKQKKRLSIQCLNEGLKRC